MSSLNPLFLLLLLSCSSFQQLRAVCLSYLSDIHLIVNCLECQNCHWELLKLLLGNFQIIIRNYQNCFSGLSKLYLGKSKLSLGEAKLLLGIAIIVVMNCQNCHLRMVKVLLGVVRNSQKSSTSCLSSLSHRIKG